MRELSEAGVRTFVATEWDGNKPYASFWRALRSAHQTLSQGRAVDILHSHSEFGDVAALLLRAASKSLRVVRTVHNGYHKEWRKRPLRRIMLTNWLYPMVFAAEIGVSPSITRNLNRRWLATALQKQAIFVPNAVDLTRFADVDVDMVKKKKAIHLPSEAQVVGSVGRLVEAKGYKTFLEAAAIVLREMPNVYFLLVGDGELASHLRALADQLGISRQVVFTGPRSDVEEILACMDLFVSSSLWEGLPSVILEAMASQTPVVATDIVANKEIVQPQLNGWLVPPNHPEAMADRIIEALQNPSLRQQYSRQALRTVEAFSIEAVLDDHEGLYVRVHHQT